MEFIKISRDLSKRLQRSLSHGYFKKTPNSSNSSLTQSEYKPIIDKLDIANPEHGGSVDAIFSLLIKKNPDIENNAEFRNIRNGINAEMFEIGGKYEKKLKGYLGKAEDIKREMFELVKKFYNSGYKIIAYDVMNKLSTLSWWIDDALSSSDKNKHKIKEIFSPDSDFHKSFTYLNQIKDLLEKPELEKELAAFSTTIHGREKGKVPDIGSCVDKADSNTAARQLFSLSAKKGRGTSYVFNTNFQRNCDYLELQDSLNSISKIKGIFAEIDKQCNIAREANGEVGIFDINNKNSTQTYVKDKQKRFNDFKIMVLNIFENKEKYNAEKYNLNNKSTDFFFETIPSNHKDAIQWGETNSAKNIIKLFKAVVTEGGMKGFDYRECERIAGRVDLDALINELTSKLNAIAPEADKVKECLDDFIKALNNKLSNTDVIYLQSKKGQFFLKKHKGFNALSEGIKKITGGMSSGFEFTTYHEKELIQMSRSMKKWCSDKVEDLEEGRRFAGHIAERRDIAEPITSYELVGKLSPQDIENMKKYVPRMLERNIQENQLIRQVKLDAHRQEMLLPFRLANDPTGNGYYPPEGKHYPNFYQSPYPFQGIHPQQQMLSEVDIQRIAAAIERERKGSHCRE